MHHDSTTEHERYALIDRVRHALTFARAAEAALVDALALLEREEGHDAQG